MLGALALVQTAVAGRRLLYSPGDLAFAQELARRAGNAVERSRQYTREAEYRRVVETISDGVMKVDLCAGSLFVFTNITDRKQSEQRLAFLADAGTLLASSLNTEKILTQLANLVIERGIADRCTVYGREQNDDAFTA